MHPLVSLVIRIHTDGGVGHNGLGTGGSHHDVAVGRITVTVRDEISHMIEMALRVLMDNLVVRYGSMPYRIPVHHSDTAIYPSLLVEIHESIYYGLVKFRLHSEAGSVPVARSA